MQKRNDLYNFAFISDKSSSLSNSDNESFSNKKKTTKLPTKRGQLSL